MSTKKKWVVKKPVVVKKEGPKKDQSKMERCEEWLSDHPGLTRKEVLKAFQEKFEVTLKGSSTYFQTLKKRLNYKPAKAEKKKDK